MTSVPILRISQLLISLSLAFLAGLASCLSLWVIPITLLATSPRTQTAQFIHAITLGERYLQPSSRALAVALLSLTAVTATNADPRIASGWRYYAVCAATLAMVAPWETLLIFPINDRIKEIAAKIDKVGEEQFGAGDKAELVRLLKKWQLLHVGRIILPLTGALISSGALL